MQFAVWHDNSIRCCLNYLYDQHRQEPPAQRPGPVRQAAQPKPNATLLACYSSPLRTHTHALPLLHFLTFTPPFRADLRAGEKGAGAAFRLGQVALEIAAGRSPLQQQNEQVANPHPAGPPRTAHQPQRPSQGRSPEHR